MSTLTVRNLDPEVTSALKALASRHGRSMEAEARVILASVVRESTPEPDERGFGTRLHELFADVDWDFEVPRIDGEARAADFGE